MMIHFSHLLVLAQITNFFFSVELNEGSYTKADEPKDCLKILKVASGTMSSDPFLSMMYIMVPLPFTIRPDLNVEASCRTTFLTLICECCLVIGRVVLNDLSSFCNSKL